MSQAGHLPDGADPEQAPTSVELAYLEHDIGQTGEALIGNEALLRALGDTTDPEKHTFHLVTVGLAWDIRDHAAGVATLLFPRAVQPCLVVQRALWEGVANLRYLVGHADRNREAVIYLAYSYIKEAEEYHEDLPLVEERKSLLGRMDPELVSKAEQRVRKYPYTWSGLKILETAKQAGLTNFHRMYGTLSAVAHSHRVGQNVRFGEADGMQQKVTIGRELTDEEVEVQANFARRGLGAAFRALWTTVDSPRLVMRTPDPHKSRVRE